MEKHSEKYWIYRICGECNGKYGLGISINARRTVYIATGKTEI